MQITILGGAGHIAEGARPRTGLSLDVAKRLPRGLGG
jgi:hypothetical protein